MRRSAADERHQLGRLDGDVQPVVLSQLLRHMASVLHGVCLPQMSDLPRASDVLLTLRSSPCADG
eukprot:scaffold1554_cov261-Pinguiococcus_pyrenoidosus.AAC.2